MFLRKFLALLLVVAASGCPDVFDGSSVCRCSIRAGEYRYRCEAGGARFIVDASINRYIKIYCQSGNFSSDVVPPLPLSHNITFSSVTLTSCPIPTMHTLLRRVGATGTDLLLLKYPQGGLDRGQVVGLEGMRRIHMIGAASQTSLPYEAIVSVPSLADVRVVGGQFPLLPPPRSLQLQVLELSSGSITRLEPGLFKNLGSLVELHLWGNRIEELEVGAFEGLHNLTFLDLSRNPLNSIRAGCIADAGNLTRLHLVGTRLKMLTTGVFSGLAVLNEIKLDHGKANLTLEDQALTGLPSLQTFTMTGTTLTHLPSNLFGNSTALKTIDFSSCHIKDLSEELLNEQKRLEVLNLSKNQIRSIPVELLEDLVKLELLDLSDNVISDLPDNIFAGLTNLKTLKLDNNQLTSITEASFIGLQRVQSLTLSHNSLSFKRSSSREDISPFVDLVTLKRLDLSHNDIEIVCDDWRMSLYGLEVIDLSWNRITRILKKDMEFLPKNRLQINLEHNNISTIEIGDDPDSIATLLLGDNPYNCDCQLYPLLNYVRTHNSMINLETAICHTPLSHKGTPLKNISMTSLICPLTNCPENCNCSLCPSASFINLDCNSPPKSYPKPAQYNLSAIKLRLQNLTNNTLPILPIEVISLNLSQIGISEVPLIPKTVKELDLSYNQLSTIPQEISNMNLTLYIAGNPLECSCENENDIATLLKRSNQIVDSEDVVCHNSGPLLAVIPSNLCKIWWISGVATVIATLGIILGVAATLIHNYSEEIKRHIYKRGWNMFIYEEELDNKKYDVLVSYAEDEEKFVVQEFVPKLRELGCTVTARYKDWDIGVWIPLKVAETVDESRRVLVILTKNYLKSIASLELNAAKLSQLGEKRNRLLIISKDETYIDCLKQYNCMDYNDSRFWEILEKALPKKRKVKNEEPTQATLNVLMTAEGKVAFARNKGK